MELLFPSWLRHQEWRDGMGVMPGFPAGPWGGHGGAWPPSITQPYDPLLMHPHHRQHVFQY